MLPTWLVMPIQADRLFFLFITRLIIPSKYLFSTCAVGGGLAWSLAVTSLLLARDRRVSVWRCTEEAREVRESGAEGGWGRGRGASALPWGRKVMNRMKVDNWPPLHYHCGQ